MNHDVDEDTKVCRRCGLGKKTLIGLGWPKCGSTPTFNAAASVEKLLGLRAAGRAQAEPDLVGDDPTPDLIVEEPCSDGSAPPFGR